ncbi:MAG: hypothetical protein CMJ58_14295 [Planctomycetaceae bacterium]|nr:hypothetical protein [Planctomycetaceae bacterium]
MPRSRYFKLECVLAFPEAEGFGRYAKGARTNLSSASVYHVTNLNDSGPGSFRDAVSQSNRFVVFDVGGIVNINSGVVVSSNVTIAGQTAPGGIAIYGDRVSFSGANNVVSRHFAIRKGNAGVREDASGASNGANMMFDHMSITWGVDETFSLNWDNKGNSLDNISIQDSIIAQGLDRLGHSAGGLMTLPEGGRFSIVRSLFSDNVTRNPKVRGENEFINNVVYGWESAAYIMGDTVNMDSHANVIGNYFIEGPVNSSGPFNSGTANFHIYGADNWVDPNRDGKLNGSLVTSYPGADVVATPHAFPTTASLSAQDALAYVMENAGPSIVRDAVDTRLMQEVASYGAIGGVIDRETDLFPGYGSDPAYLNVRARLVDADNDGIADNWESDRGRNPANPNDWKSLTGAGYTWLEEYVNELGGSGAPVASAGGNWSSPASWSGGVPTLADAAEATGELSVTGGHAFARRLTAHAGLSISGGTVDVFDTAMLSGVSALGNGSLAAGRVQLAASGSSGVLTVATGGTLRTGSVDSAGGAASLVFDGGAFQAGGPLAISVPTTLAAGGGAFDTNGQDGAITAAVSGVGGLTKRGAGQLTLAAAASYAGPTVIEQGELIVQHSAGLSQTTAVEVASGAALNMTAVPSGLLLTAGKSLAGGGTVVGNVAVGAGAVVRPQGQVAPANPHVIAIQAEDLALGPDWAVFDNAVHGTGAGGSYDGADLNGGGIVLVANEDTAAPRSTGAATTTVDIGSSGTWYLFVKSAEPNVSPIPGDAATQPRGNNSLYVSASSGSLQATTANYDAVQTNAFLSEAIDAATWNRVSPTLSSLSSVFDPEDAGIDYVLTSGLKTFAIHGREAGTILDGFVLSDSNLTAAELEAALSGAGVEGEQTLTITGHYWQSAGATFAVEVAGGDARNKLTVQGTATLGGDLLVELADGFTPRSGDKFSILQADALVGQFANAAGGARIPTADRGGSFVVTYDATQDEVSLSNYAAALAGDFNFDLSVDQDDLAWWQANYGALPTGADLLVWQRNLGATAGTAQAVPEPASAVLLLSLAAAALAWRVCV